MQAKTYSIISKEKYTYDSILLDIDTLSLPQISEAERNEYILIAEFLNETKGYFFTQPDADSEMQRWLAALVILGVLLDELDLVLTSWLFWARWLINTGDLEIALEYLSRLEELNAERGNTEIASWALNYMANIHQMHGDVETAIKTYKKSLAIQPKDNSDPYVTSNTLLELSSIYLEINEVEEASELLEQLIPIADLIDDPYLDITIIQQLGGISINQNNIEDARLLFDSAMDIARRKEQELSIAEITNLYGLAYLYEGKSEEAEAQFAESLRLAQELNYHRLIGISTHNLGIVEFNRGKLE